MKIEYLQSENTPDFIAYCKKYRESVDDSFLIDEEIEKFTPDDENPTYIVLDEKQEIVGAVSLLMDSYFQRGKRARFRIFHSVLSEQAIYKQMLETVLQHAARLEKVFLFVPEKNKELQAMMHALHFTVERYAYMLTREDKEVPAFLFPTGYSVRAFQFNQDEEDYCIVRNAGFAKLAGSETPVTPEEIHKMQDRDDFIEEGTFLLYDEQTPVGVVRTYKEDFQGAIYLGVGPLALVPAHQGKGLGRNLLRTALLHGQKIGLTKAMLSVNADNENAINLYIQEGFQKEEAFVCFQYFVKQNRCSERV
ncbi:GNAT family N-acetyltransferase [Bacillus sp. 165]|uniref:GNAT family N-acetyltransferase n=1 Tax=Bacillus sp. 165 TaxID=1529117 RepID=UPI001ADAC3B5|nr:GNAT family N-acetyltransferase [Bacillus sp. 165]MBO9129128.1 GNAT family N-acetyltransferase [Bacillus sp. 165]